MINIRLVSPIPMDTNEVLKAHNWKIDNISLLLNKYLDFFLEKEDKKELLEIAFPKNLAFSLVLKDDEVFKVGMNKLIEIKYKGYEISKEKLDGKFFTELLNCNKRKTKNNSDKYEEVSFSIKLQGRSIHEYNEKKGNENKNKENCELINRFLKLRNKFETNRNYLLKEIKEGRIKEVISKINERQENISDCSFSFKTSSRLVVGLGSGSVLEVSIKLHHVYGVPYIPSSAVKGVLRAYKIWELANWDSYKFFVLEKLIESYKEDKFDKVKEDFLKKIKGNKFNEEFKEIKNDLSKEDLDKINNDLIEFINSIEEEKIKKLVDIFGNQEYKGKLIFLDAYPKEFKGFDIDIMNVHFPDYYQNNEPPADWQQPNPITFLAIPEGTTFRFYFKNTHIYGGNLKEDLRKAFRYIGLGAKTAIGYGFLE
ncbi:hypothetical protein JCM14244_07850 [Venenivibrio stagnispumantis]|uniref:CRISPR-associated protein Cmr6 n=1 Tax=Venenivibrio stagnispumantis TaxID=407998 RepID=A0AA45WNV8_9AQUI|nr:type III-B CRISPR module RAMP protein Cmr6 [Venenivibrio stagnispumantis]MCW4573974.1 type III-B CRISPR module RAMP protein Cmr6 [Venenivibrio stagnispumantis]SMP19156.1 CRISPR-associated protein Cmr6 [Venenivibrio stagnispumantis]